MGIIDTSCGRLPSMDDIATPVAAEGPARRQGPVTPLAYGSENRGQMAGLVRAHDWPATSLGPREGWPQSLCVVVDLILASPLPMVVLWGPSLIQIYNDGYARVAGAKHPAALGQPTRECWPEVWDFHIPIYDAVLKGETRSFEDEKLVLLRQGVPEDCWFDLTYSPVPDGTGGVAGVLVVVIETTVRMQLRAQLETKTHALRHANLLLAAEGRKLRSLFQQAPGFMCVMSGPDHVFELVNAAHLQLIGHRDVLGKAVREALPELEAEDQQFPGLLDNVYASGRAFTGRQMEFKVQRQRGGALESRYVDLVFQPITDGEGRVSGIFIQGNDVSEAKLAGEALRESEAHLHHTIEFNPQIPWTADAGGKVTSVHKRWLSLTGLSHEAAMADGWMQVPHPDDRAAMTAAWSHAVSTGEPYQAQARRRMADGSYRWMQSRAFPRRNVSGEITQWYGYTEDVHDRRLTEEALRESEARFQVMADSIDQMIWSARADGFTDYYNQRWYEYTGTERDPDDGERWHGMLHPDDQDHASANWRHSLATGERFQTEYRLRHNAGAYRWVLGHARPVRDDDGRITRWYGTCTDIQEIVEAREASTHGQEELEQLVTARTADLHASNERLQKEIVERAKTEEQLRQSQKMEAVGQLTGGIAHDFNNLLQGMSGSLDMIRIRLAQGRRADFERYMTVATASIERATSLTQRLLAFGRRQTLDPKSVDANQLVAGIEDLVRRTVGADIVVETVFSDELWPTLCDANQLESAVLNLAINARDAMPGGGRLTIKTANAQLDDAYVRTLQDKVEPGPYVSVSVTDTGAGMTLDVAARAFEPFFTTKGIGQGTGLGLSMVYGFTKQSQGHAHIYSEKNRGTTVRLYLPRHPDDAAGADIRAMRGSGAGQAEVGETVLVVEDEAAVRMLVMETMQDQGYRALEAADGEAGLQMLRSHERVDLLVTDIGLPGMNGRQLADAARERRPDLKVLFITGYAHNPAVSQGASLKPGMALIHKPFALAALADKVRVMIQG